MSVLQPQRNSRWGGSTQEVVPPPPRDSAALAAAAAAAARVRSRSPSKSAAAASTPRPVTSPHAVQFGLAPRFGTGGPTADAMARRTAPAHWHPQQQQQAQPSEASAAAASVAASSNAAVAPVPSPQPPASSSMRPSDPHNLRAQHSRQGTSSALRSFELDRASVGAGHFRQNQDAVVSALAEVEQGLGQVSAELDEQEEAYDQSRARRTEVARALNLQLRKRSKLHHQGVAAGSATAGLGEETVDSILDAISSWFALRSTRALADDALLSKRESAATKEGQEADEVGGGDGALHSIFSSLRIPPATQAALVAKLKQVTGQLVQAEGSSLAAMAQSLRAAHEKASRDGEQLALLEDALEKAAHEAQRMKHRLAEWEGSSASAVKKVAAGTAAPLGSPSASSATSGSGPGALGSPLSSPAGRGSISQGAGAGGIGGASSVAELEGLLRKKTKLLSDAEKKRVRQAAQITTLSAQLHEKDSCIDLLSSRLAAATGGSLLSPSSSATQSKRERDELTQKLLAHSHAQHEESFALRTYLAHSVWEREAERADRWACEIREHVAGVRSVFERFIDLSAPLSAASMKSHLTSGEVAQPELIVRALQASPVFASRGGVSESEIVLLLQALAAATATAAKDGEIQRYASWAASSSSNTATNAGGSGSLARSRALAATRGIPPLPASLLALCSTLSIPFGAFLSFTWRHGGPDRAREHARLWRRMIQLFEGLDADRNGVLECSEVELAFRREGIDVDAPQGGRSGGGAAPAGEGMDAVWFCITSKLALPAAASSKRPSVLSPTAAAAAVVPDAALASPFDLFHFASLFSISQLRTFFAEDSELTGANPASERRARLARKAERLEEAARRESKVRLAAAAAGNARGRRGKQSAAAAASSVSSASPNDDGDDATPLSSAGAPYYTHGTRAALIALLAYDPDHPVPAEEQLSLAYFNEARVLGNISKPAAAQQNQLKSTPFLERAVEALCASGNSGVGAWAIPQASTTSAAAATSGKIDVVQSKVEAAPPVPVVTENAPLSPRAKRKPALPSRPERGGDGSGAGMGSAEVSPPRRSQRSSLSPRVSSEANKKTTLSPTVSAVSSRPASASSSKRSSRPGSAARTRPSSAHATQTLFPPGVNAAVDASPAASSVPQQQAEGTGKGSPATQQRVLNFAASLATVAATDAPSSGSSSSQVRRSTAKRSSLLMRLALENDVPPLSEEDAASLAHAGTDEAPWSEQAIKVREKAKRQQQAVSTVPDATSVHAVTAVVQGSMEAAASLSTDVAVTAGLPTETAPKLPLTASDTLQTKVTAVASAANAVPKRASVKLSATVPTVLSISTQAAAPSRAASAKPSRPGSAASHRDQQDSQDADAAHIPPPTKAALFAESEPSIPASDSPVPSRTPDLQQYPSLVPREFEEKESSAHAVAASSRPSSAVVRTPAQLKLLHQFMRAHAMHEPVRADFSEIEDEEDAARARHRNDVVRAGLARNAPVSHLLDELAFRESEARTFRQLYDAERARVAQLEKLLRGQSATSPPPASAWLNSSERRPATASSLTPRAPRTPRHPAPPAAAPPLIVAGQFGDLISRRGDGAMHAALLAPHSFDRSTLQPAAPYPRLIVQRPKSAAQRS